jgi:hypothetical protein
MWHEGIKKGLQSGAVSGVEIPPIDLPALPIGDEEEIGGHWRFCGELTNPACSK